MLLNRAKVQTATTGTGAVTLGAAVAPFRTWTAAGAVIGAWYPYLIEEGAAWEIGVGLYNGTTLTRPGPGVDPFFDSSSGGTLLSLGGAATIACVANKQGMFPGTTPVIRSFNIAYYFGSSVAVPLPAGAAVGDIVAVYWE